MIFSTTTKNTLGSLVYISLDELFFFTLGLTYIIHKRRQLEQFKIICMIMNGLTIISQSLDDWPVISDYISDLGHVSVLPHHVKRGDVIEIGIPLYYLCQHVGNIREVSNGV